MLAPLKMLIALLLVSPFHQTQGATALATVPIELVGGYIFLSARIDESEKLNLLFDTGATSLVLDSAAAEQLGLVATPITRNYGEGSFVEQVIESVDLTIADHTVPQLTAKKRDTGLMSQRLGVRIDGVIGADLLRDYVVEIDYDSMTLSLYDSDGFVYSGDGSGLDIISNRFFATVVTEMTVAEDEVLTGRFLIDTGAGVTVALNTPFVNDHDLLDRIGFEHIAYTLAAQSVEMTSHPGRIPRFHLGDHSFEDMPLLLSQTEVGPLSPSAIAGIIGNQVWKRFNMTFDYSGNKLYLEPSRFYGEAFRVDCSGMMLHTTSSGAVAVRGVLEGSPAAEAGVEVGDLLVEIGGGPVSGLAVHEIGDMLARCGQTVALVIGRNHDLLKTTLKLRKQY